MKIGVLGVGFVGGTHAKAFEIAGIEVAKHDIKFQTTTLDDLLGCELIFVCLPSPTKNGQQDLTILQTSLEALKDKGFSGVLCVKSTVLPGTVSSLRDRTGLRLVHCPEFLKERTALQDFFMQKAVLIGGCKDDTSVVAKAYQLQRSKMGLEPLVVLEFDSSTTTEMAKYMHNTFLALKVAYANQFKMACDKQGVSYDEVKMAAVSQGVIGSTHLSVPGPDGKLGFSGTCFPKDVKALLSICPDLSILEAAQQFNESIRPHDANCFPVEHKTV